ncbi:hypothetical protein KM176_05640 [Pseudooceanicola sp. CBS1P-1]|uniref:Uncharacterized protein n=1 Tax=Pseudooceanicola albus TaxID=2692189 RepID=A0A6L7FY44_9RHOB|nr:MULTISPECIES: hypothetical protein [Pseudooceanicola]MBT9383335.1 hypothetical protein [Pseudooceanicola endophyticus]MXN16342.1 hypothetical protein [Pseudooceanicola albus]
MEIFAMVFAVIMIALACGAVALVWFVSGWLGGLVFALMLFGVYRLATRDSGQPRPLKRDRLNAFQHPLSDD